MNRKTLETLQEVFDVLDDQLGDTDPHFEEDITGDEIKTEHPLFWACQRVGEIIKQCTPVVRPVSALEELKRIPTMAESPNGLHQRYNITKASGEPVDPRATYFVLRIDEFGSDWEHIRACRAALWTYCNEIQLHAPHLRELCRDLRLLHSMTARDWSDHMEGHSQV